MAGKVSPKSFMKPNPIPFLVLLLLPPVVCAQQVERLPGFQQYRVDVFKGKIVRPKSMRSGKTGEWRNEFGKLVDPPEVNFAGRFYIGTHSCGTGCRYYSLTDLKTGGELRTLDAFAAGEEPPQTKDGRTYLSVLHHRPFSNLLIVQYELGSAAARECRERSFAFEYGRLKPVTGTRYSCRQL